MRQAALEPAEAGQYENLGQVAADDDQGNIYTDADPSQYFGVTEDDTAACGRVCMIWLPIPSRITERDSSSTAHRM